MTIQSDFSNFGAPPPAPTGLSRLLPRLRTLATGGALATLLFLGWQKFAPDGFRPGDIAGAAAGAGERHEVEEKRDAVIAYERGKADAAAQANAKAQVDVAAIQKALDERTSSLQAVSGMARLADMACALSQVVAGVTDAPSSRVVGDWRRSGSDPDWHGGAVSVAKATCGRGDQLRADVTRSQLAAIRQAAAARGVSMTNGAVAPGE